MFADLHDLESVLKVNYNQPTNWHAGPHFFCPVEGGLKPGTVNIAPVWFEQGHEVGSPTFIWIWFDQFQTEEHQLKVSADLTKPNAVLEWLKKCSLPFALIGGILSIIQPELYNAGWEALKKLSEDPGLCDKPKRLLEVLSTWYTPFSALAVISNQSTPLHRDTGGRPEWLDLMVALGVYEHGRFAVPGLGYTFKYNPGTIVAFLGKIFRHGAECAGDRACIAFNMCDNVLNQLGIPIGSWLLTSDFEHLQNPFAHFIKQLNSV